MCRATQEQFKEYAQSAPKSVQRAFRTSKPSVLAHPIDSAFAFTFNALQGATVDRVVMQLRDLSGPRLGSMTLQKANVGFSRVRHGSHVAIWPATAAELQHLTKLKFSAKVLGWYGHYTSSGWWKSEPLVLPGTFTGAVLRDGLGGLAVTKLKELCKQLNVQISGTSRREMEEALQPALEAARQNKQAR